MLFKTHIVFSLAIYLILSHYIAMPLYVLVFVLLSTAFVDIDVERSKMGNRWYLRPFQWFMKHRGFLHGLLFAFLLSLIVGSINLWAGFGFFVGYISHLFLDCLTRGGIGLFWPFGFKIRGFIKSGGIAEDIIFVLLLLGDIVIVGKILIETVF